MTEEQANGSVTVPPSDLDDPSSDPANVKRNTRGNNPLKPFMGEIFEKIIKPRIAAAYTTAKEDVEKKQVAGDEKATLTIGLICDTFNTLNEGCEVSSSTFSAWMKECGYKSQRVTTIEPAKEEPKSPGVY